MRGINKIAKYWKKNILNSKKKDDNVKKIESSKKIDLDSHLLKKTSIENDALNLLYWIKTNKNSNIVLTETKLKTKEDTFTVIKIIKKITNNKNWIFCNNLRNSDNPKHGTITITPKRFFSTPKNKVIKAGMVTETTLKHKQHKGIDLTIVSYYNPNRSQNPKLSSQILAKYSHQSKVIIAGDFNEIMCYKRDYFRRRGSIKDKTIKNKKSKAADFKNNIKNNNFFYNLKSNIFTHQTIQESRVIRESRIDWILFSSYFKEKTFSSHKVETAPINTDHKIVRQTFSLPDKEEKKENHFNKNKNFQIPDQAFENVIFVENLKNEIKKINKTKIDATKKLKKILKSAKNIYHSTKKSEKETNLKKIDEKIKKCIESKENDQKIPLEEMKEANQIIEEVILKEINRLKWKNKIGFERIKGPNKIYTNFIKKKSQVKTTLTHLEDEKKNIFEGVEAANLAKDMMQKVYTSEKIDIDSIEALEIGTKFDEKMKEELNEPFTVKEIREAIRITPNKAPGPSGVRITFFKKMIDQISPILTEIANKALLEGKTSDFLMKGLITLIPKKENSNNVNDLRPITLLEIARKIITKAMTIRIKKCLANKSVINPNQFCHPGRIIHENILTLNLLVEDAKANNKNLHAVFLDCSKAFDRVNHEYLLKILEKKNCGDHFLNFIKTFLKGKSRINFNNNISDEMFVDRGVPQGETLSPFLFILAIDPLLNSVENDQTIKGIKVGNKNVKIMAYADDLVLISDNKRDLEKMISK